MKSRQSSGSSSMLDMHRRRQEGGWACEYHGPPLLLPQREAKQEVIVRPLSALLGLKHLILAPSTLLRAFGVADGSGLGG